TLEEETVVFARRDGKFVAQAVKPAAAMAGPWQYSKGWTPVRATPQPTALSSSQSWARAAPRIATERGSIVFERIIRFSIEQRWLTLLAVLGMAALGLFNYQRLPIDAVPDITNVQVQVNTAASGYSPLEVEQRITYPLETVMAGMPGLEQTRSLSRYGLSQITVIFKEGTDIYFARQLVNERLQEIGRAHV